MEKGQRPLRLILASIGSFLVFTSIPIGLYVYAKYGIVLAVISFLLYCSSGLALRAFVFPGAYKVKKETFLRDAFKASVFFILSIILGLFLFSLARGV
jgi:hypothetical protein